MLGNDVTHASWTYVIDTSRIFGYSFLRLAPKGRNNIFVDFLFVPFLDFPPTVRLTHPFPVYPSVMSIFINYKKKIEK